MTLKYHYRYLPQTYISKTNKTHLLTAASSSTPEVHNFVLMFVRSDNVRERTDAFFSAPENKENFLFPTSALPNALRSPLK